ncbi:tumor necrosis factor receptor superfamily member EDAR-like isoform X2 [Melanotaenia boesemani]|uniref:tumor necrosis factor receptor superfamily member EDAR-like isoform X2 n=1 Tax=Melanotaenia boesemani TaxID=1250792 RepID=UPI001C04BB6E|nr:tumor necrosis factor receptor superfamily member EDAR-like isoform X2 [Melanotaenia boesemani]
MMHFMYFPMETCIFTLLLMVPCKLVLSEPSCDQTEFLHPNGTCVACPVCKPGEQLSEDCGFGDGGEGVCIQCEEGTFSTGTGEASCRRCTKCNLLNRLMDSACSPTSDTLCGQCLPGFYELRSMTGEVELFCVPCYSHDTAHEECLLFNARGSKTQGVKMLPEENLREPEETKMKEETFSVVMIGAAIASLIFLIALLLWVFLLTARRFKQIPEHCSEPEGLLSAAHLQNKHQCSHKERAAMQPDIPSETISADDTTRGLGSLGHENEMHPTSIVINVTTNFKPCSQSKDNITQEEQSFSTEEMEQKLQTIWEIAQGQSIEMLDYDSIQDLSLLLDSADSTYILRRLGLSLGVPPQVTAHLHSFQDLFQYLRTSTYTQLPQLAQAAALLPNLEVVSRIHRAVVNK